MCVCVHLVAKRVWLLLLPLPLPLTRLHRLDAPACQEVLPRCAAVAAVVRQRAGHDSGGAAAGPAAAKVASLAVACASASVRCVRLGMRTDSNTKPNKCRHMHASDRCVWINGQATVLRVRGVSVYACIPGRWANKAAVQLGTRLLRPACLPPLGRGIPTAGPTACQWQPTHCQAQGERESASNIYTLSYVKNGVVEQAVTACS